MARLRPAASKRLPRRGIVIFEALAAIPLFLIVLLGGVGMADLLITEQLVSEASGRAARKAAMGGSTEEIDAVVRGAAVVLNGDGQRRDAARVGGRREGEGAGGVDSW